ncbi:energy transducer TonB [Sphingomonas colocasiae]|uniref:Energy transducer TonB n=1 Tax=Sphingomonas colocasiae TaxID=1848973 RepID=A0ABS7PTL3_9SPHN|nr:energy transducer TonB [Sphingomonas colocasiae]MBY8823334.1 energy transducer TonB [Sphingomonas colocasiae]
MNVQATLKKPGVSTAGVTSVPPRSVKDAAVAGKAGASPVMAAIVPVDDSRRLMGAGLASLGVHGAVAAALFVGFAGATPAPPMAAMVVEMAELPSAPPAPPTLSPPTHEQKKAEPEPVIDKLKLPPIPKLAFNITPDVAVPVREKQKEKKEQADKPAEETTHQAAPEAPNKDKPKAPQTGAPSNSNSRAEQSWEAKVLAALERRKRYPDAAQSAGQEDVVQVRIVMDRSGRVINSQIRRSRGFSLLDGEVAALVRRASPLPKPPQEVTGEQIALLVPVEFFMKKR